MPDTISFRLNDRPVDLQVDGNRPLLWVLRTELGVTGPKFGCGSGFCGCCTVLIDQQPTRTCILPASAVAGKTVVTIEGLAADGQLHPLQKAFMEHDALQCGFCTPGMILRAWGLLHTNPHPTEAEIIHGMEENFCRCGTHPRIVAAVQSAAAEMNGGR
jgi:aerobic-type carbon monoxide dehydrogenase small subunit (CoxS/CutS family)